MAWIFGIIGVLAVLIAIDSLRHPDQEHALSKKYAIAWLTAGLFCCAVAALSTVETEEEQTQRLAQEEHTRALREKQQAQCRTQAQCWGEERRSDAERICIPALEQRAKYGFEWTDSYQEPKFDRRAMQWKDQEKGHLSYFGDKLRLQNVFGTFQQVWYRCDYDADNHIVLHTRIVTPEEGILKLYSNK